MNFSIFSLNIIYLKGFFWYYGYYYQVYSPYHFSITEISLTTYYISIK